MSAPRRVVAIEPYAVASHRAWVDGLAAHSHHDVTVLTLPGRHWRWRQRGGAADLAEQLAAVVARQGPPDVLLVSNMVDLAALLGAARRVVGDPAVLLYLHESQVAHPGFAAARDDAAALVDWSNLRVADAAFVGSEHHRRVLLDGLADVLARVPDRSPIDRLDEVSARLDVLPVGVELAGIRAVGHVDDGGPPLVLWNHRWDHDKAPEVALRSLTHLAEEGVAFRVAFLGENRRADPREVRALLAGLGDRVVAAGWVDRADYLELLTRSDVVVSTARQELFGVAVVEAMAAGAVPVLPRRWSYPELLPPDLHDACLYPGRFHEHLRAVVTDLPAARARTVGVPAAMARWSWEAVAPRYDDVIAAARRRR